MSLEPSFKKKQFKRFIRSNMSSISLYEANSGIHNLQSPVNLFPPFLWVYHKSDSPMKHIHGLGVINHVLQLRIFVGRRSGSLVTIFVRKVRNVLLVLSRPVPSDFFSLPLFMATLKQT
uniref:Uncharacterized protein n=1 Tax=Micrurus paraensis TaxID=1970185 RepID=A0A2D4K1S8_9SAUR